MKPGVRALILVAFLGLAPAAWAITWDKAYEGDVMPNLADPIWNHAGAGGTSTVADSILYLTNGNPAANNSWDAPTDAILQGKTTAFEYNDPDVAGENWVQAQGQAFTIEWRMRVNGPATLTSSGQTGIKLTYGGYPGSKYARFDWYYDATNHRLPNNQQTWGSHGGKTGPEGAETDLSNDGFDNIQLGEWHTYKVTSVNMSGKWHRELWLDGNYVGRWWDDKTSSGGSELKMRANNTTLPDTSVDFDYVHWAGAPDGRFVRPVVCPTAPTITAVTPNQILPPAGATPLTFSGTDLNQLLSPGSSIALVSPTATITGTGTALNGNDLVATFDLTGAAEGDYDVVGTQAGGCSNPIKLPLAFRHKPNTNLLRNSVFEATRAPWTACTFKMIPEFGYGSHTGAGYISAVSNWGEAECIAEQTVTGLQAGPIDLTLSMWAMVWDNSANAEGYQSYCKGEIVVDGTSVAATPVLDSIAGPQSTWQNLTAQWSGTLTSTSTVLVRLTLRGDGRGGSGWGLVNVDDVELTMPANPCNTPFADIDNDQDVDQEDFGQFQLCFTGNTTGQILQGCACFDRDKSGTIDQMDYAAFGACVNGPAIPAVASCENAAP